MAQTHGLHTNMQPALVGDRLAQHGRLLWWTAYTLDQKLSSLMGTPNTIHNEDISAPIPQIPDSDLHTAAISIHVKLSQLLGSISISKCTKGMFRDCQLTRQSRIWAKRKTSRHLFVDHTQNPQRHCRAER